MKKLLLVAVLAVFMLGVVACGGGGDKAVMKDYLNASKSFVADLEKADNADSVVSALNNYSDIITKLMPKMKELSKKYPDLNKKGAGLKMPEEFKEFEKEMQEVTGKMGSAMMKVMKYLTDPKVIEANKKFMAAMQAGK